jgi:hypothetical protein
MSTLRLRRGSSRWYDEWSRYLALLIVGVTLVTTSIVFLTIGQGLGGVGELVTVCVGLIGLVIALQLEILFRVSEKVAMRDELGRLLGMVEDFPDLLPVTSSVLTSSVATLRRSKVDRFRAEVISILNKADVRLQELAQGRLRMANGDNTLTLEKAATTRKILQGTTDEGDTTWWLHNSGALFFDLNARLIEQHKVEIERVWILAKPPDRKTREVLDKHRDIGVKIFLLRSDRRDFDRSLLVNMTMMDGAFLHEDLPNKQGQAVEYLFSENVVDLERAESRFAQLKSHSVAYTDEGSLDALFGQEPTRADSG